MPVSKPTILSTPDILLPDHEVSLEKWATIACDQFTSNKAYWDEVNQIVGDAPSTVKITFPEYYLGKIDEEQKIKQIHAEMEVYLRVGILKNHHGMILVERQIDHGLRYGLLAAIDLEDYDYTRGATSWIRASEGTVAERIPPRMRIREAAPLEVPHILVLIDDEEKKLIEPLAAKVNSLPLLYDFDLMMHSGHIRGFSLADPEIERQIYEVIAEGQKDETIQKKYGPVSAQNRMQFAVGDGNHSLATAKAIWEKHKAEWGMDHPGRYALVEIQNLHDPILEFEPIHRVLFGVHEPFLERLSRQFGSNVTVKPFFEAESLFKAVDETPKGEQSFGVIADGAFHQVIFGTAPSSLCVGSVQQFLDQWKSEGGFVDIDYIHGQKEVLELAETAHNVGIYLPAIEKGGFFQGIIEDGALPRKTFSMGEAHEKRFYIESRRIL